MWCVSVPTGAFVARRNGKVFVTGNSGFPKSLDVERAVSMATCPLEGRHFSSTLPKGKKALPGDHLCPMTPEAERFQGYGTALKPSYEPCILARKPREGTIAGNVTEHGTGALAIEAARLSNADADLGAMQRQASASAGMKGLGDSGYSPEHVQPMYDPAGRWPPNVAIQHAPGCKPAGTRKVATGTAHRKNGGGNTFGGDPASPRALRAKPPLEDAGFADPDGTETVEAWECVPGCQVRQLDEQSGDRPGMSGGGQHREGYEGGMFGGIDSAATARGDSGGASRFYKTLAPEAETFVLEQAVLARKPARVDGERASAVHHHGVRDRAVARLGFTSPADEAESKGKNQHASHGNGPKTSAGIWGDMSQAQRPDYDASGRWPANVTVSHADGCREVGTKRVKATSMHGEGTAVRRSGVHSEAGGHQGIGAEVRVSGYASEDGTEEVPAFDCVEGCPVKALDEQSGELTSHPGHVKPTHASIGYHGGGGGHDAVLPGSTGGASRFFYCPKASRFEREFGCEQLPARAGFEAVDREEGSAGLTPRSGAGRTAEKVRNYHPCVKPIALCRWLAALLLPPPRPDGRPRRILVPYSGSGSEMIGALRAGWDEVVGIQRVADGDERGYVAIARARLARWSEVPVDVEPMESREAVKEEQEARQAGQTTLFGG